MDRRELRQYEAWKEEMQLLRAENQHLRLELRACVPALYRADRRVGQLEERVAELQAENRRLRARVKELTPAAAAGPPDGHAAAPPHFVKPAARGRGRKPGRKQGHPAALRPVPGRVDVHQDVPLPKDGRGRPACPHCNCSLGDVRTHERLVEDLVPARVIVTCYHTASGYCAMCRKRVESRAPEQPPAADLPHGQLGLNALATAAVLRVAHRLPFGQVVRVLSDLPGLSVSGGAVARQLQRLGRWLDPYYERVKLAVRASPQVNGDETGWRTAGRNGYLWAVTDPRHTLYHVDESRSGEVIEGLLGRAFPGTVTCDFYSAYGKLDCPKQRCLAHLLRELKDAARDSPDFAASVFRRRCGRLVKDMLALKRKWGELADAAYTRRAARMEDRLDQLMRGHYDEPDATRLAGRLLRHRAELTRFLWEKDLDGTNNAAERALRPAVVMRKVTGGSRSKAGAQAWAKLASLMRTASQQGRNVLETVKQLLVEHWAGKPAMALTAGP
ncbi:MAG TPA: IS66 family transposase [Micromonosporaceae bacterium]|nr:IS66 family transposase [Micromonosporaceae bacterium]